jgi:hypothetical protein
MPTKIYSWDELQTAGVDVEAMIGGKLDAGKWYVVDTQRLPGDFQDRLKKDGFDVSRSVEFQAAMAPRGFAIEVHQE